MSKKYLDEEWYQKVKKKIIRISLVILIIGLIAGGSVIAIGIIKTNQAKSTNQELYNKAYKESKNKIAEASQRLDAIKIEKERLNTQIDEKERECNSLSMSDPNWFSNKSNCQRETSKLEQQIAELKSEEFELENNDFTVFYNKISLTKYYIYYFIGSGIIGMAIIIALSVYFIAKKREIQAFSIQQTMPVAQEAIDEIAPTIGNAAGIIGQGIANGISSADNTNENQSNGDNE